MRNVRTTALRSTALLLFLALPLRLGAEMPREALSAAELRLALKKLNAVGSVLYIAAHPDDENTAFLAWGSKGALVSTAYLAITRGDGGQNLIGPNRPSCWVSSGRRSFSRAADRRLPAVLHARHRLRLLQESCRDALDLE